MEDIEKIEENGVIAQNPEKKLEEMSLSEIKEFAENCVKEYNDLYQEGKYTEAAKIAVDIDEAVAQYTLVSRKECYAAILAAEDPMLEAVKTLTYQSIKTFDKKEGEEKIPVRRLEYVDKSINLLDLHKKAKDGIGHDKKWNYKVEKFNFLLTAQTCKDLGIDPRKINDSYAMAEIARDIDLGKTPTSNTNILNTLQTIVEAMIGEEYKANSHDVKYLYKVYTRKSNKKALTVSCANHKYLTRFLMDICHRIVTGKVYDVDYKRIKGK